MRAAFIGANLAFASCSMSAPEPRIENVMGKTFIPAAAPPQRVSHMSAHPETVVAPVDLDPVAKLPVTYAEKSIAHLRGEIFNLEEINERTKVDLERVRSRMGVIQRAQTQATPTDAQAWTDLIFSFTCFCFYGTAITLLLFIVYRFVVKGNGRAPALSRNPIDGVDVQPSAAIALALFSSSGGLRTSGAFMSESKALGEPMCHLNIPRRALLNSTAAAAILSNCRLPAVAADASPAIFAQRFSVAGRISPLPPFGAYSRYEDQLVTPKGSKAVSITMHFDFPQQFQQIGRALGGIAFVDGNSGLRIFVLKATLPGTSLAETPKKWFADSLFSPQGQLAREGIEIESYKAKSAKMIDAPEGAATARRRIVFRYTVITPANQRAVDRDAFADVYEIDGNAYILFTSASDTKWEDGEKVRCEMIADSFFIR